MDHPLPLQHRLGVDLAPIVVARMNTGMERSVFHYWGQAQCNLGQFFTVTLRRIPPTLPGDWIYENFVRER